MTKRNIPTGVGNICNYCKRQKNCDYIFLINAIAELCGITQISFQIFDCGDFESRVEKTKSTQTYIDII